MLLSPELFRAEVRGCFSYDRPSSASLCWHGGEKHNGALRCPLLFPQPSGQRCDHAQFRKHKGCVKDPNWERGGKMRVLLDRQGPLYQSIYRQRTSTERGNSQSKAAGLARPKVRNIHSVRNLNTLTYLLINAHADASSAHAQCLVVQHHAGQGGLTCASLNQGKQTPLTLLCGRSGGGRCHVLSHGRTRPRPGGSFPLPERHIGSQPAPSHRGISGIKGTTGEFYTEWNGQADSTGRILPTLAFGLSAVLTALR